MTAAILSVLYAVASALCGVLWVFFGAALLSVARSFYHRARPMKQPEPAVALEQSRQVYNANGTLRNGGGLQRTRPKSKAARKRRKQRRKR